MFVFNHVSECVGDYDMMPNIVVKRHSKLSLELL